MNDERGTEKRLTYLSCLSLGRLSHAYAGRFSVQRGKRRQFALSDRQSEVGGVERRSVFDGVGEQAILLRARQSEKSVYIHLLRQFPFQQVAHVTGGVHPLQGRCLVQPGLYLRLQFQGDAHSRCSSKVMKEA